MSKELTRVVGREGQAYRNFTCDAAAIRARARKAFDARFKPDEEKPDWPEAKEDAIYLALMVETLIDEKQNALNLLHAIHEHTSADMCPACGGCTWGRPMGDLFDVEENGDCHDYSKRECAVCRWVRPEPPEGPPR